MYVCARVLVLGTVQTSCKLIHLFYEYLIHTLCSWSKLIISTLKISKLLQMNLHHVVMMTSHKHHLQTCDGIMELEKEHLPFYLFTHTHETRRQLVQ